MEPVLRLPQLYSVLIPQLVAGCVAMLAIGLLPTLVLRVLRLRSVFAGTYVCLELTPPAQKDRSPSATQQLMAVLHSLATRRTLKEKLVEPKSFALEIVSSRKEGIRFLLRVAERDVALFEQTIHAYMPEVKTRRTYDYSIGGTGQRRVRITSFRLRRHFAYPLLDLPSLEQHDPLGYLTGSMTKLGEGELVAMQLIVTPAYIRQASALSQKILSNHDFLPQLNGGGGTTLGGVVSWVSRLLLGVGSTVTTLFHGSASASSNPEQQIINHKVAAMAKIHPERSLSAFEQELVSSIHGKLAQPLFRVDMRALVIARDKRGAAQRAKSLEAALMSYDVPKYQGLRGKVVRRGVRRRYTLFQFRHRAPSILTKRSNILSSPEIASLYHFPHSVSAKTENVIKSLSKTLPAPVSLKNGTKLDVLLGENVHHGSVTPIGLTAEERQRHVYVIGGTGNGKTTMLLYGIIQDIEAGEGLAVIDPHGDLAQTILGHIPPARIRDVVYINPDDLAHPVGLNLLELPKGLSEDDLAREKDLVTESTISVLRKLFSEDDSGGHRVEYILRNTIQTALTIPGSTLFTIFDLLNNTTYREKMVRKLKDKQLKDFWNNELGKAGEFQRVKMTAGVTAKIGRFLFSASAKRILEQPVSTIDFDDILASNKILICNFSKGLIGEDTSALFGTTVLAKLQLAALRRARLDQAARQPFYLYVDEFQNFATMSFVQMLSEARKYKLFLIMAEQSTAQQDQQRLVDIILANVGTVVSFRSGSPADERFILPLFSPYIEPGEIASLTAYSFYVRIAAVEVQEPLSGVTVLLKSPGSDMAAGKVVESSRATHGNFHKVFNSKTIGQPPLAREGQEVDIVTTSESDIEPVG